MILLLSISARRGVLDSPPDTDKEPTLPCRKRDATKLQETTHMTLRKDVLERIPKLLCSTGENGH